MKPLRKIMAAVLIFISVLWIVLLVSLAIDCYMHGGDPALRLIN